MNKKALVAIIVAAVVVPIGAYAVSPLFINNTIDEPLPTSEKMMADGDSMDKVSSDSMKDGMEKESMMDKSFSGTFVGVDAVHDAKGMAKIITLDDGSDVLRLEDFRSTNGPDLYVYLATDETASDFVNLGRLKANIGNQNYNIPEGTDLSKYDSVLVWCKQFSVLFGKAELSS
ncbi:MAG TPA: DM13 domain-containing protein [Nitrosopumilaceae archaeon]|nr:DM13 domain-containing protein [Nitrosopumilaceae archaeon]